MPGTIAFDAEVTNISGHCLWVLVDDEELALPFSEFPWFRSATIDQVLNVVRPSGPHLYWPDLDVDLSLDSIRHPDHYPLKAKVLLDVLIPHQGTESIFEATGGVAQPG